MKNEEEEEEKNNIVPINKEICGCRCWCLGDDFGTWNFTPKEVLFCFD